MHVDRVRLAAATAADLAVVARLEAESYPPDEAASPERLAYRVATAPHLFYVLRLDERDEVVGFICGTAASSTLDAASLSAHDPAGTTLCIHSVVIAAPLRRRGLALWMLREYLRRVSGDTRLQRAMLLAHGELIDLYAKAGFACLGRSPVVHGASPWFDMSRPLVAADAAPEVLHVDAFVVPGAAGSGNAAAVVLLPAPVFPPRAWMQALAADLAVPGTAFLLPRRDGRWGCRWFTPLAELGMCGHATLAAAHAAWDAGWLPAAQEELEVVGAADEAREEVAAAAAAAAATATAVAAAAAAAMAALPAGAESAAAPAAASLLPTPAPRSAIIARRVPSTDGGGAAIELQLPSRDAPVDVPPAEAAALLAAALPAAMQLPQSSGLWAGGDLARRLAAAGLHANAPAPPLQPLCAVLGVARSPASGDLVVHITRPLFDALAPTPASVAAALPGARIVSFTASAAAGEAEDGGQCPRHIFSRCFAAGATAEDAACGAAHVGLAHYYHHHHHSHGVEDGAGGDWVRARQASPRGAELAVRQLRGEALLRGACTTVLAGRLRIAVPGA